MEFTLDSLDGLPEAIDPRSLYSEKDGKFVLTGVKGARSESEVSATTKSLGAERDAHKATKEKYRWAENLKGDDVLKQLDRIPELEAAAAGKTEEMDAKLEELTEKRVNSRVKPIERERDSLKGELAKAQEAIAEMTKEKHTRQILDTVGALAESAKILPEAMADMRILAMSVFEIDESGNMLTRENPWGIEAGLTPELFMQDMQTKRPLWWGENQGGGGRGSGGKGGGGNSKNPWLKANWNMTEQGKIYLSQGGQALADRMKAEARRIDGADTMVRN